MPYIFYRALTLTLLLVGLVGCQQPDSDGSPDAAQTVLLNGRIYTVDASAPWVEAVAIADGKYVFVGTSDEAQKYVDETTRVFDLQGAMVMPGINDTHSHPWQGGLKVLYECNFAFDATPDEIAEVVRGCVEANPDAEWIRGGAWTSDFFQIFDIESPRLWLDAVSGDKAVYFEDDSAHNAWVNTKALALAGITADSPDPKNGVFVRDEQGTPNGVLLETAKPLIESFVSPWSDDQNVAAIVEAARLANTFGLTGIQEARTPEDVVKAYARVDEMGLLNVHAITDLQTPAGDRTDPIDVEVLASIADRYQSDHVHTRFAKLYLDGVPTSSRSAVMLEPYLVDEAFPEATRGMLLIEREMLTTDLTELDRHGFTIKIHTAGDGSVRIALDALEQVRKTNGNSGLRHQLAHAGYMSPEDLPRFAELNVTADLSPYLWYPRPIINSIVGAVGERAYEYWPVRSLLESGADLAIGSDWPSVAADINPWPALEAMVTRRHPAKQETETLWGEQAIPLEEAIRIFTFGGAKAYRLEDVTGSIETGKSADLIVLNQNLFDIPPEAISETRPTLTMFEGQVVYELNP